TLSADATTSASALSNFLANDPRDPGNSPQDYQGYATDLVNLIKQVQADIKPLQDALNNALGIQNTKSTEFSPPLDAAKAAVQAVDQKDGPPIQAAESQIATQRANLRNVVVPGLDNAQTAIANAQSDLNVIAADNNFIVGEASVIPAQDPTRMSILNQASSEQSAIYNQGDQLNSAAENLQVQPNQADVDGAVKNLANLFSQRDQLQQTYNNDIAGPQAEQDKQQQIYNQNMLPYDQAVQSAQGNFDTFNGPLGNGLQKFADLFNVPNIVKRGWWKTFDHFDAQAFWNQLAPQIGVPTQS
ncbi:MAG: hypothetical protein KGR26_04280, partial [Cyanobacteria bacterium REEB65]|nr:hypothetical protein [Cyanobacteria bacterium REEB65]